MSHDVSLQVTVQSPSSSGPSHPTSGGMGSNQSRMGLRGGWEVSVVHGLPSDTASSRCHAWIVSVRGDVLLAVPLSRRLGSGFHT